EVLVGDGEALALAILAHERPHDPDAANLLAHHLVHAVDALLHDLEAGHHARGYERDRATEQGHGDGYQPRQSDVLAQGHHDAADHHYRGHDEHRERHHQRHLHLLNVVGVARDK